MRKVIIATTVFIFLVGCATNTTTKVLITGCGSYAVALSTLADFRKAGKLDAAAIAKVDQIDAQTGPLCTANAPSMSTTTAQIAQTMIEAATADLRDLIAKVK